MKSFNLIYQKIRHILQIFWRYMSQKLSSFKKCFLKIIKNQVGKTFVSFSKIKKSQEILGGECVKPLTFGFGSDSDFRVMRLSPSSMLSMKST